jgi:hypothetical protein
VGLKGSRNPNWKGGRSVASNGYVLVRRPDHPRADVRGYIYEHRLVAEEMLGRALLPGEEVHHINGDKTDNRPENLEVLSGGEHKVRHRSPGCRRRLPDEPNEEIECGCGCGERMLRFDVYSRPRRFVPGHNIVLKHKGRQDRG